MKKILVIACFFITQSLFAGGWTTLAEIDRIEVIRGQGLQVFGAFGNPADCTVGNGIYIPVDHPQYDEIYSTVMIAFTSNKKINAYLHTCTSYGWHGGSWGTMNGAGALNVYK